MEQLVKAIDSNEDGQIQLSEFKYWLAPKPEETEKRDMMEIRRKKVVDLIMKTYQKNIVVVKKIQPIIRWNLKLP